MALFDAGPGLDTVNGALNGALGAAKGILNTASNLAGALNNLSNPAALISKLRSINLPFGGEVGGKLSNAAASFGGADASNDWRVRLSVPSAFMSSGVLSPLVQAGGLVFPYTPSISINSSASYEDQPLTHQNYQFTFYQNSRVDRIQIVGAFNVEDGAQALYWLAAVHLLRSATKMFTGEGDLSGNPPPILILNGDGDYVFKNVPVVVTGFSVDLPADVNYINTSVAAAGALGIGGGSGPLSSIAGLSSAGRQLAGLAGAVGANQVAGALGAASAIGGAVAGIGGLLGGLAGSISSGGSFGTSGNSWVPVKSSLNITLQPIYSREMSRQFSLQTFVNGGYVNGGYI
jgi:hypothetical protein